MTIFYKFVRRKKAQTPSHLTPLPRPRPTPTSHHRPPGPRARRPGSAASPAPRGRADRTGGTGRPAARPCPPTSTPHPHTYTPASFPCLPGELLSPRSALPGRVSPPQAVRPGLLATPSLRGVGGLVEGGGGGGGAAGGEGGRGGGRGGGGFPGLLRAEPAPLVARVALGPVLLRRELLLLPLLPVRRPPPRELVRPGRDPAQLLERGVHRLPLPQQRPRRLQLRRRAAAAARQQRAGLGPPGLRARHLHAGPGR